ncbi:MAG TPA: hypothetical protein VND23_06575 [Acidimicrobiales bacterium]|nr:hypothetical protein [Acidimicrobiales bacterium]
MVAREGRIRRAGVGAAAAVFGAVATVAAVASGAAAQVRPSSVALHRSVPARASLPVHLAVAAVDTFPGTYPGLFDDSGAPSFPAAANPSLVERWVSDALSVRANRLAQLQVDVAGAANLSTAAQTTLGNLIDADAAGIGTLVAEAPSGANVDTLEAVASSMVLSYRVIAVVSPLVRDVIDASDQLQRAADLQSVEPALEAAITTEPQTGSAVAVAQSTYRDLVSQIAPVAGIDQTQLTAMLALHPASYVASSTTLGSAESAILAAEDRVRAAGADERKIVHILAAPGISSNHRIIRLLRSLLR